MSTEVVCVEDRADVAAELRRAGEILRRGGLVAFPTETVYGIAVAATVPEAVERLYAIKGRPRSKPMTVMVSDVTEVRRRCPKVPAAAERLMERFWPGPLTLVLKDAQGHMTGFRVPNHPLALGLVREAGVPLLVPSANRSTHPAPVTAEAVLREFPDELDLVIDGGSAEGGVPSSVVQVTEEGIDVLRVGAIPEARLLEPRTEVLFVCTGNTDRSPLAAALLARRLAERLGCSEAELEARGFTVRSAGLEAPEGKPASPAVVKVAKEWLGGPLDLEHHRARRLTEEMLERATHVFCMERRHREEILAFFPNRARDVRLLDPEGNDVEDPAGRTPFVYKRLVGRLDAAAALLAGGLVASASSS
jgi:tRNA threonylcarbamoyl adenosine modification protein (Sua5/YciO/YrdC/YwlC family)